MGSSTEADAELRARVRQQEVVAELGQQALETDDLDQLMHEASVAVAETLDADFCGVFECWPDVGEAFLRQGVGWRDGLVEGATVPADADSAVGAAFDSETPLVFDDLHADDRFSASELLASHGVVSGVSVVVGPPDDPWGVLGVYATDRREFTETDANFVQSTANVLASAVENERTQSELEEIYGRISDAFFALDREWRFTYLNERAHEMINPEGRRLVGENIWEAFPEGVGREFEPKYEEAMYEQETVSFEEYYPDPLDSWFEVRAYPSETGLSVYFRDVTDRREREEELRRKERRFEAIFEDPNILVGLLDTDGTVLDINQTAMEYIDADFGEVQGEPFWETPWWGEGDEVGDDVRRWTERAANGEYVDFEADLTRPDGQRYTLNGAFRPVTNDEGEVVSVIVSDRDVTQRVERERALAQSEQRYRTLAEAFPNGLVTLFDGDLRYTLAAGQAFDDLPVSRKDVEGRTPREAWGEDVGDDLESVLRAALDGEKVSVELSYVGRDWVVHAVPITDARGDVFAGMTMAQDITERKEYQRRLEESERRYRTLAENFPNGAVGVYDHDLRYTLTKGAVLGDRLPSADRLEGDRVSDLFPEHTVADLEPLFRRAVEEGESDSTTTEFGGRNWKVWAAPLRADGEIFAGLSFTQDITERVERERRLEETVEKLEESNERLESFASMLAHELRNPVTIGQIYSQQLPDGTDSEAVEYVAEAFDRIEEMIDVMLVLTRGRDAVGERTPVDLAAVAREAWDDVDAPDAALDIGVDRTIRADETYVRHLFRNLLENAVEHGGEDATVTVGDLPTGFYVADDGPGIPPDDRETVFEEGYTTAAGQGGTGLGLAFVRELADVYGWDCAVTESESGGARFEFTNVERD